MKKKGIAPFRGKTKRCKTCKQVKQITEFSNTGHQSCSSCTAFTHGGRATMPSGQSTSVPVWIGREAYDGSDLRPFEGRAGALDAYQLPSRGAFL